MSNNQSTWGALRKAWRGHAIAKNKYEYESMEQYATVIQKLKREVGLRISSFSGIGLSTSRSRLNSAEVTQDEKEEGHRLKDGNYEDE